MKIWTFWLWFRFWLLYLIAALSINIKVSLCLRLASELCVAISEKESTITAYNAYFSSSQCSSLGHILKNFPGGACPRTPQNVCPPTFTHSPATPKLTDNPDSQFKVKLQKSVLTWKKFLQVLHVFSSVLIKEMMKFPRAMAFMSQILHVLTCMTSINPLFHNPQLYKWI